MHSSSSCSTSSSTSSMKRQRATMLHRGSMPPRAPSPTLGTQPALQPSPPADTTPDSMAFGCFTAAVTPRFFASPTSERGKKESAAAILRALAALQHETEQVPTSQSPPSSASTQSTPSTRSHHPQHRAASATEAMTDVTVSLAPLSAVSAHDSRNLDVNAALRPPMGKRLSLRRGTPTPAVAQRWRRGHRMYWRGRSGTSTDIGGTEGSFSGKDFKMIKRQEGLKIPQDLRMIMEDEMQTQQLSHQAYEGLESSECSDQARDTGSETTEDDIMSCVNMHRQDMHSIPGSKTSTPGVSATDSTYSTTPSPAPDPTQILMAAVVLTVAVVMMVLVVGTGKVATPSKEVCVGAGCGGDWTEDEVAEDDLTSASNLRALKSTPNWAYKIRRALFSQGDRSMRSSEYADEDITPYDDDDDESEEISQDTKGRYTHQYPYRYIFNILQKKAFGSSRENSTYSVTE